MPKEFHEYFTSCFWRRKDFGYCRKLVFGSDSYVTIPEILPEAIDHYQALIYGLPQDIQDDVMGGTVSRWTQL